MALSDLSGWKKREEEVSSACGAGDKPTACGAAEVPAACGAAEAPTACGAADK